MQRMRANQCLVRVTHNRHGARAKRYPVITGFLLEPVRETREGAVMPRPPNLFDMREPSAATRLAQGLLIVAIMALIVIATVSTH